MITKTAAILITAVVVLMPRGCEMGEKKVTEGEAEVKSVNPDPMPVPTEALIDGERTQEKVVKTDSQWRELLTGQQYRILRQKGTERAFTGEYDHFFGEGEYLCAGCGAKLFGSESKYNSGCGWPAFTEPAGKGTVDYSRDTSHGMIRTEVTCSRCGGHLGHVFDDGPGPAGKRYCINSAALKFQGEDK